VLLGDHEPRDRLDRSEVVDRESEVCTPNSDSRNVTISRMPVESTSPLCTSGRSRAGTVETSPNRKLSTMKLLIVCSTVSMGASAIDIIDIKAF
jgi:hypothetical protein